MRPVTLVLLVLAFTAFAPTLADASTPIHQWSAAYGSSSEDKAEGIAVDASGNVIVTSAFYNTGEFGTGPLVSAGGVDVALAKYDSTGSPLWTASFGGSGSDRSCGVALDASGNIYVGGTTSSASIDFGGGPLPSLGSVDVFLAKFDPDGDHLWSRRLGDTSVEAAEGIAIGPNGDVFLIAFFLGTTDLGGGPIVAAGGSNPDMALIRYDVDGNHVWSQRIGGTGTEGSTNFVSDGVDVYLLGDANAGPGETIDLGGGVIEDVFGYFVAKYDGSTGLHVWSRWIANDIQTGHFTRFEDLAVNSSGDPMLTGNYLGPADLGGGALPDSTLGGAFLVEYDSATGGHLSSRNIGFGFTPTQIAIDADDDVFLAGNFSETREIGGNVLASAGLQDAWLGKFAPDGTPLWSTSFGGPRSEAIDQLVAIPNGDVVVAAQSFEGALDFGDGPLPTYGRFDVILAAFAGDVATSAPGTRDRGLVSVSNHPNPFNPSTAVQYTVARPGGVRLTIHDVRGARVATLVDGMQEAGTFTAQWNGRTDSGQAVGSGVYYARMENAGVVRTQKMTLVK